MLAFEWYEEKAKANVRKHGVSFEEASSVFADESHSDDELREIMIGHSLEVRLLIVSFTERSETIRIISAREASRRERRDYEQRPIG